MECLDHPRTARVILGGLVAPLIAPLLSIVACWLILNFDSHRQEIRRWFSFEDLWSLHLLVLAVAYLCSWCIGWPLYRRARSKNVASVYGMCVIGSLSGVALPLLFTIAAIFSQASLGACLFWCVLCAGIGAVIGLIFALIAGLPRDAPHSLLLQRD
jgi:ABC-type amino acid transport system permease subunit